MFPLQLLALIFIATPSRDHGKDKKRTDGQEGGRTDGQEGGRTDGQEGGRTDGQEGGRTDGQEGGRTDGQEGGRTDGQEGRTDRKQTLRRGDLLVVPRTLFTHFGIYLGGDRVAHFIPDIMPVVSSDQRRIRQMVTNTRLLLGVLTKCGSVRVDSLDDFAYGSEILVNTTDKVCGHPPLQGEEVAARAEKLRGHVSYSLLWYNCEHYVMYCRYGTVMSFQTFQFCKTVRSLLLSRRVAKVTALLGACLLLYVRAVSSCSALLALLLPFLIWMAS